MAHRMTRLNASFVKEWDKALELVSETTLLDNSDLQMDRPVPFRQFTVDLGSIG
jgi:hypothetical protein